MPRASAASRAVGQTLWLSRSMPTDPPSLPDRHRVAAGTGHVPAPGVLLDRSSKGEQHGSEEQFEVEQVGGAEYT